MLRIPTQGLFEKSWSRPGVTVDAGKHYGDVIMGVMASQITSLMIVYSTVYSGADQRKHQSSASLAFVWGIHRWPVNSPHKWPVTRKMFPFDYVIMGWVFLMSLNSIFRDHVDSFLVCSKQMEVYDERWNVHEDISILCDFKETCVNDKHLAYDGKITSSLLIKRVAVAVTLC